MTLCEVTVTVTVIVNEVPLQRQQDESWTTFPLQTCAARGAAHPCVVRRHKQLSRLSISDVVASPAGGPEEFLRSFVHFCQRALVLHVPKSCQILMARVGHDPWPLSVFYGPTLWQCLGPNLAGRNRCGFASTQWGAFNPCVCLWWSRTLAHHAIQEPCAAFLRCAQQGACCSQQTACLP